MGFASVVLAISGYDPANTSDIPGSAALVAFAGSVGHLLLYGCLLAILGGVAALVVGRLSNNGAAGGFGVTAVFVGIIGAALIVGAQAFVNGGINLGGLIK